MLCCHHEGHSLLRNFGAQVTQKQKTVGFNTLVTAKLRSNPATRRLITNPTPQVDNFAAHLLKKMWILSLEQQRQICDALGNDTREALEGPQPTIRTNGSSFNDNTQLLERSEASESCASGSSLIQPESQAGVTGLSPSLRTAQEITATNCPHGHSEGVQRVPKGEEAHSHRCEHQHAQKETFRPLGSLLELMIRLLPAIQGVTTIITPIFTGKGR